MTERYTLIDHTQDNENHFADEEKAKENKDFLEREGHDVELIDNYRSDGGSEATQAEVVEGQGEKQSIETAETINPETIKSQEQFVTQVKGVPDAFMVNMGTPQDKSIHIKKEGYYYLAAESDIDVQTEPLNPSWEGDDEFAAWKATATKGDKEWSNVGTATLDGEDMSGAEYNLDELASTRAACRALSMATGAGVTSSIEMMGEE